jgi:predicted transcriptional regulator
MADNIHEILIAIRTQDYIDKQLVQTVREQPGIRMSDLARAIDLNYNTARWRVMDLEVKGLVMTERSRSFLRIYPR